MKETVKKAIRRTFVYGICYLALMILTVVVVYEWMKPISGGPSYSINDLQHVETSLQNYYIEVFADGKPTYPATLQDLVSRRYITQAQLNRFGSEYFVDYYHPPKPDISGDSILFRAMQKMPVITYSVSGRMRMEAAVQPAMKDSPVAAASPAVVESTPPMTTPSAAPSAAEESTPAPVAESLSESTPGASPSPDVETTPPQASPEPSPSAVATPATQ